MVWNFFEKVEQNGQKWVLCTICKNHYRNFGSTSNMIQHLTKRHANDVLLSEVSASTTKRNHVAHFKMFKLQLLYLCIGPRRPVSNQRASRPSPRNRRPNRHDHFRNRKPPGLATSTTQSASRETILRQTLFEVPQEALPE